MAEELWIALAHVLPLAGNSTLDGAPSAFCHVVAVPLDEGHLARQVERAVRVRGLQLRELDELAPVSLRERTAGLSDGLRELAARASSDRELQFGEFFVYDQGD